MLCKFCKHIVFSEKSLAEEQAQWQRAWKRNCCEMAPCSCRQVLTNLRIESNISVTARFLPPQQLFAGVPRCRESLPSFQTNTRSLPEKTARWLCMCETMRERERERARVMTFGLPCLCKDRWLIMVANAQLPYSRLSSLFRWNLIAVLLRVFTDSGEDESLRPAADSAQDR